MKKYLLQVSLVAIAFFGIQSVAAAQCTMDSDVGCGSEARQDLINFVNCVINDMPAPPNYNHPNCGFGNSYQLNFSYYVDGDGDISMDLLEGLVSWWLDIVFGGVGGGRSISVSMPCNERAWNVGTLTVSIVCN
ncbi:MAG TPA: hypothetical protein DCE41_10055 [Cytophagales bacterium]|nr:hypothetical protein [Cytophagales bacterium]HAA22085.1 hypothetical protein [Cytophagales bacterium]HAP59503.1 hypothetical protein [Cytophagales bacterium]